MERKEAYEQIKKLGLQEEFFNIEQQLKRQMDAGVEPSMMEAYRGLYLSAQTAGDVVKSMQDKE